MTDWPFDELVFFSLVLIACTLVIIAFLSPHLVKDLHYQCCMLLSFVFYGSHFCQICKLFYNMGCP